MLHDMPSDASITTHNVKHGDVLVFGTDGVWDNLSSADVLKIVSKYMTGFDGWVTSNATNKRRGGELVPGKKLREITSDGGIAVRDGTIQRLIATAVAAEAKMTSMDQKRDGPFAREVHKYYPSEDFHGGKVDDICVIVAVIVDGLA